MTWPTKNPQIDSMYIVFFDLGSCAFQSVNQHFSLVNYDHFVLTDPFGSPFRGHQKPPVSVSCFYQEHSLSVFFMDNFSLEVQPPTCEKSSSKRNHFLRWWVASMENFTAHKNQWNHHLGKPKVKVAWISSLFRMVDFQGLVLLLPFTSGQPLSPPNVPPRNSRV